MVNRFSLYLIPWWWEYIVYLSLAFTLYWIGRGLLWLLNGNAERYISNINKNKSKIKNPIWLFFIRLGKELETLDYLLD